MRAPPRFRYLVGALLLLVSAAAPAFRIEGVVTAAAGGQPIAGVLVKVACAGCFFGANEARTDANGRYSIALSAAGLYTVRTAAEPAWTNQIHPAITCADVSCFRPLGLVEPVELVDEGAPAVVDFALEPPARLTVRAFDAVTGNAPISPQSDTKLSMTRDGVAMPLPWNVLPPSGAEMSLPAGTYLVTASHEMYATTRFPDHACSDTCEPDTGTPVVLAPGARVEIAIAMAPRYGWIRGRVVDALTAAALEGVSVVANQLSWRSDRTDSLGLYEIAVPTGMARVRAATSATHVGQGYPGIDCPSACAGELADIEVRTLEATTGIDFALSRTGAIAGTVRRRDGSPIVGASVSTYHAQLGSRTAVSDAAGRYVLQVPPGSYQVSAIRPGFATQYYAGRTCAPGCTLPADWVAVRSDATTTGIDFALDPGGQFVLYLVATDINRFVGGTVTIHREDGVPVSTVAVSGPGAFSSVLPYGRYRLVARVDGYLPTPYGAARCPPDAGCWTAATPLELSSATAPEIFINLQRPPRARVLIRALDTNTNEQLEAPSSDPAYEDVPRGYFLVTFLQDGKPLPPNSVTCAVINFDRACDVPLGEYRLSVIAPGYGDVRWPGAPCEGGCAADAGSPVVVDAGASLTLEVKMERYGYIEGHVRDARGAMLHPVSVEVFDGTGRLVRTLSTHQSAYLEDPYVGQYGGELAPGPYFVRTRNTLAYVDQLHAGIACPDARCDASSGTPVDIGAHEGMGLEFNLGERQILLQTGFE